MHRPKGAFRLYSSDPAEIICTDTELLYDSKRRGEPIQRIPLTEVVSVEVEDGEAAQARVTATRLVALGILAFAAKKRSGGDKWLMIETKRRYQLRRPRNRPRLRRRSRSDVDPLRPDTARDRHA